VEPGDRIVDTEVLVVLRQQLHDPARPLAERHEVIDQIEQAGRVARRPQHRLHRHDAVITFAVDLLPLGEVLPTRRDPADPRVRTRTSSRISWYSSRFERT